MTSNEFRDGYANDDERLSALIDGELGANAAAALEARLAAEPALAARLKALRGADRALRDAYAPVADELLPAELLALLADADESGDEAQRANVIPLGRRPEPRRAAQPRSFWIPTSIAAGIALAVGVTLGISLNTQNRLTDTEQLLAAGAPITPDRELFAVIEATPSGQTVALAGTIEATPRLSFQTADGGYCRELALTSSTQQAALVGCRRDGSWAVEAVIQFSGSPAAGGNNGFVPANGPTTVLDALVGSMMAGAPLGAEAEREALATGWQ